jgi:ribosomal protein L29
MKNIFTILLTANLLLTSVLAISSERTANVIAVDTTERLENIKDLQKEIRTLKLKLTTLEIAVAEAQKKPASIRTKYLAVKKIASVVTTISLLVVTVAAYREGGIGASRLVKPASAIASISSTVEGVTSMLSDLSDDELEVLTNKLKQLRTELAATQINHGKESNLLCSEEPSNQMCLNFRQK